MHIIYYYLYKKDALKAFKEEVEYPLHQTKLTSWLSPGLTNDLLSTIFQREMEGCHQLPYDIAV